MADTPLTQADTTGEGNTKSSPAKVNINYRARKWVLTINNYNEIDIDTMTQSSLRSKKCVWQEEIGESGTPHLQVYIEYKNPRYFKGMKKVFPTAHIEKCIDPERAIEYCQKVDTRIPGTYPRLHGFPKKLKLITELRPWQTEIENIIKQEADDRKIFWIWENEGNVGKTAFAKYICKNYNALYCAGKSTDIKYLIVQYFEQDECNKDDLVCIFDYTRSMENFISYEAIESIKNGIFTSTKYETKMVLFNSPHIFIFANFYPDVSKLSKDRWIIKEISYDFELIDSY